MHANILPFLFDIFVIMKILIVAATNREVEIEKFKDCNVLFTGIGIPNTIYSLTKELAFRSYDLIVNIGIAGSFNKSLEIGDTVEVTSDTFSDLGAESDNNFLTLQEIGFNVKSCFVSKKQTHFKTAKSITVNTIHGNTESIKKIKKRLNPDIESMEGGAVMMVSENFNIPCIQIRAISNIVEKRNKDNWNISMAISNLNYQVRKFIDCL